MRGKADGDTGGGSLSGRKATGWKRGEAPRQQLGRDTEGPGGGRKRQRRGSEAEGAGRGEEGRSSDGGRRGRPRGWQVRKRDEE